MAPLLEDPRLRQTWNNISHNAETVTETAATGVWQFLHNYINPCFVSIGESLDSCTTACFPNRDERARRARERTRGRAEYSFDFYDDWDDDIVAGGGGGLLGWGNDELDRLLVGSGSRNHGSSEQPSGRKRKMSYGTGRNRKRKGTIDGLPDPTVIPSTSKLGFLQRLPFKFGGTLRYKPSAADLQDHPGAHAPELGSSDEIEPLIENEHGVDDDDEAGNAIRTRDRSSTQGSGETSDSFRSRGDLFPSDGEDDAVPLPDEFAISLTGRSQGDASSSRTKLSKGKGHESTSILSRTRSRTSHSSGRSLAAMAEPSPLTRVFSIGSNLGDDEGQTLSDLEQEDERVRKEEEEELRKKREAASRLAVKRGLSMSEATGAGGSAEQGEETKEQEYFTTTDTFGNTTIDAGSGPDAEENENGSVQEDSEHQQSTPSASDAAPATSETNAATTDSHESSFVPARLPHF